MVAVVCAVVVIENRYDRLTTTSSIDSQVEVLYADLSTGRAVSTGRVAGQPHGGADLAPPWTARFSASWFRRRGGTANGVDR